MSLVAMGYGLTLVSDPTAGQLRPGVVLRPIAGEEDEWPVTAVWSVHNSNPALERLLAIAGALRKN